MRKTLVSLLVVVMAAVLVTGCAKPPQTDIDAAKAAFDTATQAEADRYAADEYNAARSALDAANAEVEKQNAKFALFRSYGEAKKLLQAALTSCNTAKTAADANKEAIKVETQGILDQATAVVAEVKALMEKAPRGKEGKAALEMISADVTAVEGSLGQVSGVLASGGDYIGARDTAKSALDKANSLKTELEEAIKAKKLSRGTM